MQNKYPIGGYAPGNYHCKCCTCGNMFNGDKRAVQCEPCAVKDKAVFDALSPTEQEELIKRNSAIAHIMFSYTGSGDQIIANQIAGMPLEEAIFQAGYSAGYDNGYERGRREADDWISVNDQLPSESGRYWCYVEHLTDLGFSYFQWNCDYNAQLKRFSDMTLKDGQNVTHWRDLPAGPKR